MSYARFSDRSDVYVFLSVAGCLECCGCSLATPDDSSSASRFTTTAELLDHLKQHRHAGDKVPESCIDGLRADQAENDAWIAGDARDVG